MADIKLHIQTLGQLHFHVAESNLTDWLSHKAKALLVYLACEPEAHSRSHLASLLWEDAPPERLLGNLRMALSVLQKTVAPFLDVSRQWVSIRSEAEVQIDAIDLERQVGALHLHVPGRRGLSGVEANELRRIVELYLGDFLSGFTLRSGRGFEEWQFSTQERLRQRMLQALEALVRYALESQQFRDGILHAQRLIKLDPLTEDYYRNAMLLLAYTGQRGQALEVYAACRRVLAVELGLEPSLELRTMAGQIEGGAINTPVDHQPHHNLPRPLTPFVLRPADMAEISVRLVRMDCRLLTLVGLSGTGKTRLALQAAANHLSHFRDGVHFVSLAEIDAAPYVATAIARVLELKLPPRDAPRAHLLKYLSDKDMLLVLDNFDHLLDAAPLIEEMLDAAPSLKILATCVEKLGLMAEWSLPISGLGYPAMADLVVAEEASRYPAIQLFVQAARRKRLQFRLTDEWAAVVRICHQVEGLPLGLELAAAWSSILSCAEIADQIDADLSLLSNELRNVPAHHRSIRVLVERVWRRLSDEDQRALVNCAVFRGSFDEAAAAAVAEATPAALRRMYDKGLLRADTMTRYRLHELVRRAMYEKLLSSGEAFEIQTRHFAHFLEKARAVDASDNAVLGERSAELDWNYDNVRQALHWSLAEGGADQTLQLAGSLGRFWVSRGYLREGRAWLNEALHRVWAGTEPHALALAVTADGHLAWRQGDLAAAQERLQDGLRRFQQLEDANGIYRALNLLGNTALAGGKLAEAQQHFQTGLEVASSQQALGQMATSLAALGLVESERGNHPEAERQLLEALALSRQAGQTAATSVILNNLGVAAWEQQAIDRAENYYEEALILATELRHRPTMGSLLSNLAEIAAHRGQFDRSLQQYRESLDIFAEMGNRRDTIIVLENFARLALTMRQAEGALTLYGAAETLRAASNARLSPREQTTINDARLEAQCLLDPSKASAAFESGKVLSLEQAVAYARTIVASGQAS